MTAHPPTSLLTTLQSRYGIGPRFTQLYLESWFGEKIGDTRFVRQALRKQPARMWFEFAMTTNQRGEEYARRIKSYLPATAQRYLDVGCGYGGFLNAFAKLGLEVLGIEISPRLVAFAKANLQDNHLPECVVQGDILDPKLVSQIGKFDLITCNDVIEHVLDAAQAMQHMASLLNPGGILVMTIPNKDSLSYVARDGHFSLFGITLLDRPEAIQYHNYFDPNEYGVGDYYAREYYEKVLQELGCKLKRLPWPRPRPLWKTGLLLGKVTISQLGFIKRKKPGLPRELSQQILEKYKLYMKVLFKDALSLASHTTHIRQYKEKYLADFWSILAQKE
jgi:2-polyprenyl-3-methyl-5-hydroxy-6-metoxy-1,4-benzoquinol methylase